MCGNTSLFYIYSFLNNGVRVCMYSTVVVFWFNNIRLRIIGFLAARSIKKIKLEYLMGKTGLGMEFALTLNCTN